MPRIITVLILLFSTSFVSAQENILSIVDSLYDSKNYPELIRQAETYLSETDTDQFTVSKLKYDLANSYYRSGDFITCWTYIQDAYNNANKMELADSSDVELFIDIAQRLADYCFQANEHKIGISSLDKALSIGKERLSNDPWRLGKLYHKAGAIYRIMTQFDLSIEHLEAGQKYLPKLNKEKENYLTTVFLAEMAQVYNDNSQLNKSISIFKTILKTAYKEDNKKRISIYNNNIGIAYQRKGDYGKSEYHLRKSLEAKFEMYGEKTPKIISNYTNLAHINTLLRRYNIAEEYYQKLDQLITEVFGKDHAKNGDTQYNRGTSFYQQKLYSKALTHFKESVRIRKLHKAEDDLILGESLYMLGATMSKLGQYDAALPLINEALLNRSGTIKAQDAQRKNMLTSLYETHLGMGNETKALTYLEQSFEALNYASDHPYAFDIIENPIALIDPLALKLEYISSKIPSLPNEELIEQGIKLNIVADSLIQHIKLKYDDVATRRIATAEIQDLNEAMIQFNYAVFQSSKEKKYIANAFNIIEQSNNTFLYEAIAEENSSDNLGLPIEILQRKSKLQDSITILHKKLESFPIDIRTQSKAYANNLSMLNAYKNDLYAIIKKIEIEHPKYFESIYKLPEVSLDNIQSQLNDGEVILSYFNGNNEVFGLFVTSNSQELIALGKSEKIEFAISDFLNTLKNKSSTSPYLNASKYLHKLLLSPFDLSKNSSISIIADDVLSLLPFEILIDEHTNLPMLLSHTITYQYSNTLKINASAKRKGKGSLAMAPIFEDKNQPLFAQNLNLDDRYRSEVSYLPETKEEVNSIYNLLKGDVFIGKSASETQFKSKAPQKALLHLATHGFVDNENPDFSRLYFNTEIDSINDGLLYAHEIVNMDLSADLVTLSACNTGTGKILNGEGISSLGRAFAYANCPNQLISLWPANDKSTTQLMTYYYTNLKNGMGKSSALTQAKREYLSSAPEIFKHPYYWAGFVYYGQDNPLKIGNQIPYWIWGLTALALLSLILLYKKRKVSIK